ncbi:MAG: phosphopyruvate hydratase [Clostridia bacterium]|nr:phosphopyruvate hydratase [Clostridia bacterium]
MKKAIISNVCAREILDSRGTPTVATRVELADGASGEAAVPSGASTGIHEAYEKRDGDPSRYKGKGVLLACENVREEIAPVICGHCALQQYEIDQMMIELDSSQNKSKLGANAILSVSLAVARAAARSCGMELFAYLGGKGAFTLPVPMMNILNGGAHATNNLDVQEFMIVPLGAESVRESVQIGTEIYHTLKGILKQQGKSTAVGDEGGFAPDLSCHEEALDLLSEAIIQSGYHTDKVGLAMDIASSEWVRSDGKYLLTKSKQLYTKEEWIEECKKLCQAYPIVSIEDPLGEDDFEGWSILTQQLGKEVMLVGDDLFVTNEKRLEMGLAKKCGNAVLVKPNQIGTLSEVLSLIALARENHYAHIISHRSGETEDTFIADLAVGTGAGFIKTGAPCRSERTAKYNRLMEIEDCLGRSARYGIQG